MVFMRKRKLQWCVLLGIMLGCHFFDNSPWVWEIEGDKVTLQDIEDAYEGYLFWWSVQFNTTPQQLKKRIKNLDQVEDPRELEVLSQLKKRYFVEGSPDGRQAPMFKKLLMINTQAEKSGFTDRDDIEKKLDFMNKFFIYNLYMMDQVKPDEIEVSESEATEHFDLLRKENPKYRTIPLLKGQQLAKRQLLMKKLVGRQDRILSNIMEEYKIKQNKEVDVAKVLAAQEEAELAKDKSEEESKKLEVKSESAPERKDEK